MRGSDEAGWVTFLAFGRNIGDRLHIGAKGRGRLSRVKLHALEQFLSPLDVHWCSEEAEERWDCQTFHRHVSVTNPCDRNKGTRMEEWGLEERGTSTTLLDKPANSTRC